MKIIFLLSLFLILNLNATNLTQILSALHETSSAKFIVEKSKADIAKNELDGTYNPPSFDFSLSHADAIASEEEDGLEYALGISQELHHPFASSSRESAIKEYKKSIQQETKHELHILELNIASSYHKACISKEMQEKSKLLYLDQSQRFGQLERAYNLGEVSKKDLLFSKLDLAKLQQNMSAYNRVYLDELASLQSLAGSIVINDLSCGDLLEPQREIQLSAIEEHGELKSLEYKKNASKANLKMHNSSISSLGYEVAYEKELGTRRYTVGVNIPLGSLSSQKEALQVEQSTLNSAYAYEKVAVQHNIQNYSKMALEKLKVLYDEFTLVEKTILPLSKELMELSKLALLEGEGDVMEYLDSTRSYSLNLLEMLEIKKNYYTELFELYKIADIDYGEKVCKN